VKNTTITVRPDEDGKGVFCDPKLAEVFHGQTVTWVLAPGAPNVSAHFEPTTPFVEPGPFPHDVIATVKKLPPLKKGDRFKTHFRNNDNGEDVKTHGDIIIGG
jgi:hypothetical protein